MLRRIWRDSEGSAAIEVALTAPAFLTLLLAVIECGLLLWTQLALEHGVENAARCASIHSSVCSSPDAIATYAAQQTLGLNVAAATVSFSAAACGNQVSAAYNYNLALTQLITSAFGVSQITLTASSCYPK